MAGADFYLKSGDTLPVLNATLQDATGAAVSLVLATAVRFVLVAAGTRQPKLNAVAAIVNAAAGTVRYAWAAGDTDTPGDYWGEFQVTFNDGTIETFPNDRHLVIRVTAELG